MHFNIENCNLCPHSCGVNRKMGQLGICRVGIDPLVASIVLHKGEETVISGEKGVCNVFFAHCNLSCIYCQNYQISDNRLSDKRWLISYDIIIDSIKRILDDGVETLGFVSPSHQVYQMVEIINRLNSLGYKPIVVYNTNAYDSVEVLRELNGLVDIYLPDFKYYSDELALRYSNVKNYRFIATSAIREMIWQKGTSFQLSNSGVLSSGVMVRHLVLPGHSKDSIQLLRHIEEEFSSNLSISLMSQYRPNQNLSKKSSINRLLSPNEYEEVVKMLFTLGFHRGYVQDLASNTYYLPDFNASKPFFDVF